MLAGLGLVPLLSVKLNPTRTLPSLTVNFTWPNASPEIVESEVTSRLEAVFSMVKGVKDVESQSGKGSGSIVVSYDKSVNADAIRFEIASLIRQIYPRLPKGVSHPVISPNRPAKSESALLSYTLNGSGDSWSIMQYAENKIKPTISLIKGIHSVAVYGAMPYVWELQYDKNRLADLDISTDELARALSNYFINKNIGSVYIENGNGKSTDSTEFAERRNIRVLYAHFRGNNSDTVNWSKIPVKTIGSRIIYVTDLVQPQRSEQKTENFYRINGLNTINFVIYAQKNVNQLALADQIKSEIDLLKANLPANYSIILSYDSTLFLKTELHKITWRTLASLIILLLFVLMVSRRWRYLLIITISLLANILIAFIFYYFLGLEIHLYSLAGITVSFGMVIDNTIVMVDHIRHQNNIKVFLAVFGSTLAAIGSLVIIFFLKEEVRINLTDFAIVICINMAVSLAVALFFVPALLHKLPLKKSLNAFSVRRKRRIVKFNYIYIKVVRFFIRFRKSFLVLAVLSFGVPVYYLPDEWEGEQWYHRWYNNTLGSEFYTTTLKQYVNICLGGTLRLFTENLQTYSFDSEPQKTKLYVTIIQPDGATIEQMNDQCKRLENMLSVYTEISMYQTYISSPVEANIIIQFTDSTENGFFPYYLKSKLEQQAIFSGGADFHIYGVGKGFNNEMNLMGGFQSITLTGFNYSEILAHAEALKSRLLTHPRIKEVNIKSNDFWGGRPRYEFLMNFDKEKLIQSNTTLSEVFQNVNELNSREQQLFSALINGEFSALYLVPAESEQFDLWHLQNNPVSVKKNTHIKLSELARIEKQKASEIIYKKNQQYVVTLNYDFIGPDELAQLVQKEQIEITKNLLPLGYSVIQPNHNGWWNAKEKSQYALILLVIAIIYFICAIMLESLIKPLAVIVLIPFSFIGVFLTFYIFEFSFDQGGFASFILLSGIVVNSALYVLNDYTIFYHRKQNRNYLRIYIKAFNTKIIPILLTAFSTVLGFVPFLIAGKNEVFWFSLSVGTIGGLIFSKIGLLVYLPLLLKQSKIRKELN